MSHPPPRVRSRRTAPLPVLAAVRVLVVRGSAATAVVAAGCVSAGVAAPDYASEDFDEPDELAEAEPAGSDAAALGPRPGLPALLRVAEAHAPRLAAARAALTAAEGRAWQSELWPNPTVRLEARDVPRDNLSRDEGETWLVLMQTLSVSGRRGATISAAHLDRAAVADAVEQVRREVRLDVVRAWADAAFAQGLRDETAALARIARREAELAEARVASGSLPEVEVYELRVTAERAANEERAAGREVESSLERLRAVVGASVAPSAVATGAAETRAIPPRAELRRVVAERGPELTTLRRRVEAAAERLEAERAARVPDVDVMLAIGRDDKMREGLVEAGISFPLPVFNRNQGQIREAAAMLADARAELARAEFEQDAEVVADVAALAAAEDVLASWRDRLLPAAEKAHAQVTASVAAGTRPETEGLSAERRLAEARVEGLRAEREWRRAEAKVRSRLPSDGGAGRGAR